MVEQDKRRAKASSETTKTVTVSVRLDPKLKYLAELAARKHRRTLSSYIDWAVESSLERVFLHEGDRYDDKTSVADEARRLWDVDEAERFVKLAITYPELMNLEEQERWKMLADTDLLGPAKHRDLNGVVVWNQPVLEDVVYPTVRQHWRSLVAAHEEGVDAQRAWVQETLQKVKAGKIYSDYPRKALTKTHACGQVNDDDIPF
ncbi:hypothetical protein ACFO6X_04985 [Giesbergeria sinuosa]|uniref:Ribbon-helix-helix protein CopG domain-containing protein n=1 Tax=Giesbergeria sinuosa TaxID=80883 RepID=A0ABV9QF73_9BURK